MARTAAPAPAVDEVVGASWALGQVPHACTSVRVDKNPAAIGASSHQSWRA